MAEEGLVASLGEVEGSCSHKDEMRIPYTQGEHGAGSVQKGRV